MASSLAIPVGTICAETSYCIAILVIGGTDNPASSIWNGYSLVPCADPRYLMTRRRRVATWATTLGIEKSHTDRYVLFQSVSRQRAAPSFAGLDDGDAFVLEQL